MTTRLLDSVEISAIVPIKETRESFASTTQRILPLTRTLITVK